MEVRKGYKQTEIGLIPEDWDLRSLNTITQIVGGGTPSTLIDKYWNGKIPWIAAGDISNAKGRYVKGTDFHISELGLSNSSTKIMPKDTTIIIARGATVGRMAQLGKDMAFNQTCYCLLPRDGLDKNYLYYSMLFSVNSIVALSFGTIFGTITTNSFKDWQIPFPTLAEQEAIAEALSDADALIEAIEQLIAKKRQIKQGAMQELLTGKRRLSGFGGEWETKSLEELINCLDNLRVPLNETHRMKMQGDYPYCGANGVLGYVDSYVIDDDFILIAEDGGYFDEYATRPIAYKMSGKCWVNNHAHILKAKENINQDFIYYSLVHKNILSFLASGTRAKLNKSEMYKIQINIPSQQEEQTAIAEILSDMDAEISALEEKLSKARQVKAGMMSVLLTGKIRLVSK
jgi:type I restriction enzyme S subunit